MFLILSGFSSVDPGFVTSLLCQDDPFSSELYGGTLAAKFGAITN